MLTLTLLILGIVVLLAAVGRIWIDPSRSNSRATDSAPTNDPGELVTLKHMSEGKDSVV